MTAKLRRRSFNQWLVSLPTAAALAPLGCLESNAERRGTAPSAGPAPAPPPSTPVTSCVRSRRDAEGPFFVDGSPTRRQLATSSEAGPRLLLHGELQRAEDCGRLAEGYVLDFWQANAEGEYDTSTFNLRGRFALPESGRFEVETILPGNYRVGGDWRPRHVHVKVYDPSGVTALTTQIYFAGDEYLGARDSCQPPYCDSHDAARIVTLSEGEGAFTLYV